MRPIDLPPADLDTVRRILRDHAPGLEARAFGSRVSWTARETSDLDLVLMTESPLDTGRMAALRAALAGSDLPFRVDVADWAAVSEGSRAIIEREYVVLRRKTPAGPARKTGRQMRKFGDCAELVRNAVSPASMEDTTYIGLEHIGEGTLSILGHGIVRDVKSPKYEFRSGDILFGKLRPYFRKVVRPNFDGVCSTDIWVVRAKKNIDQVFLYYTMANPLFVDFATNASEGTKMPRAKWDWVSRYEVRLPPLAEQRAIAEILGALDDKIELNRRMNETLEATARAIFNDWFVDFGPTCAKMEGREPNLPKSISDLFPDSFSESESGKIPDGWTIKSLKDSFSVTMGLSPPGNSYNDRSDGLPFYQGSSDFGFRFPSRRKYCNKPSRIARFGDILVSVRAPVGDVNMAWETCCIGRGVAALSHKYRHFAYYTIKSMEKHISVYQHSGTVFGAINKSQIESLPLLNADCRIVDEFERRVSPMDEKIEHNTAETLLLVTLRDALLPRLVSGEMQIAEAEKLVEIVA